jgi:NAD(P) transhydrogenase subunit beta
MTTVAIAQIMDSAYLVAIVLFILAIKWMSSPATARRGVLVAEIGGALAVAATLCDPQVTQYKWIVVALSITSAIHTLLASEWARSAWK